MSRFVLPKVWTNDGGWGPTPDNEPEQFKDLPYCPFNKSDRLGKAAELSQSSMFRRQDQRRRQQEEGKMMTNESLRYEYNRAEDKSFRMVDSSTGKRKVRSKFGPYFKPGQYGRGRGAGTMRNDRGGRGGQGGRFGRAGGRKGNDRFRGRMGRNRMENRKPTVNVEPDWQLLEEVSLPQLNGLAVAALPEVEDLEWFGVLDQYNEVYDKVNTRHEKPLRQYNNILPYFVNTMDDPNIERYAADMNAGQVFATDAVLAHLMTCSRSVLPWDIVLHKIDTPQFPNGLLFLYSRDDEEYIRTMTVNETANEMPHTPDSEDDADHPQNLGLEASVINLAFSQQILKRPPIGEQCPTRKTFNPHPFFNAENEPGCEPTSGAYRYRRFTLGPYQLVARTELHGYATRKGKDEYITAYALNEWETQEWRQKIDTMKGSLMMTELKNNAFKLAKWAAQSILAGADLMKIGYVSRVSRTSSTDHVILGTQGYKPIEFGEPLNIKPANMWGIIKWLLDKFLGGTEPLEAGKYVVMKDPNRPLIRMYSVPIDAFDNEEGGDGEEDEDGNPVEGRDDEDDFGPVEEEEDDDALEPERVFTAGPEVEGAPES